MKEKKINPSFLILHSIIIWAMVVYNESIAPGWFEDFTNPDEALGLTELLIGAVVAFPILFLLALWVKYSFNNIIPIIFKTKEINYWEAFGLLIIALFFGL